VSHSLQIKGNLSENNIIQFIDYQGIIKKEISYSNTPINVKDLPRGIYLVRTKSGSWQQRILITK